MINNICQMSPFLAYAMLIYVIASVFYMIRTRSIGTPFKDSLTLEQIAIKKKSSKIRKNIFYQGAAIGLAIVIFLKPFQKC